MKIKTHYLRKIAAWLLPYTCLLCQHPANRYQDLCEPCKKDLPLLKNACVRCAIPLDAPTTANCGFCQQNPPPFDTAHALYSYEPPIGNLILALKFNQSLIHARVLGELMAEKIQSRWYQTKPLPTLIIPVPLHPKRLKERGFNQALEIARPIAKILQLPIKTAITRRIKHTDAQAALPAVARQNNIKNAFIVTGDLRGQHLAVIDDVMTTGHTMTEFCKTLKRNGAGAIDVWCCARPIFM